MRLMHVGVIVGSIVAVSTVAIASSNAIQCANNSGPCISYQNTGQGSSANYQGTSGYGSRASSQTGTGLEGKTSSGYYPNPGVEGESVTPGANDGAASFGVAPILAGSPPPAYGVVSYGGTYGVVGSIFPDANAGSVAAGVFATDNDTTMETNSAYHSALLADSHQSGIALYATSGGGGPNYIQNASTAIYAVSTGGYGGLIESDTVPLTLINSSQSTEIDFISGGNMLTMYESNGTATFDDNGDETLSGNLTTSKSTYVRTRGSDGTKMVAYGARTTAPRIEDDGEARLVNGSAVIRLDAQIADVIDRRVSYMVFITPEGDSNGLYVTQKSPAGFVVREQHGGHATLDFSYRILAKPIDEDGARLALVTERDTTKRAIRSLVRHPGAVPLSPDERLRKTLGPAKYASLVRELKLEHSLK